MMISKLTNVLKAGSLSFTYLSDVQSELLRVLCVHRLRYTSVISGVNLAMGGCLEPRRVAWDWWVIFQYSWPLCTHGIFWLYSKFSAMNSNCDVISGYSKAGFEMRLPSHWESLDAQGGTVAGSAAPPADAKTVDFLGTNPVRFVVASRGTQPNNEAELVIRA